MSRIRLAVDSRALNGLDLKPSLDRLAQWGADGIDLFVGQMPEDQCERDPFLSEPSLTQVGLIQNGLAVIGLTTDLIVVPGQKGGVRDAVQRAAKAARSLRAPLVTLLPPDLSRSINPSTFIRSVATELLALAEMASPDGVRLCVQSRGVFQSSEWLWRLLELTDHPSIGCQWDLTPDGATEPADRFAPTLNHRIQHVRLPALPLAADPAGDSQRESTTVDWRSLALPAVRRLAGIGYSGAVTIRAEDTPSDDSSSTYAETIAILRQTLEVDRKKKKPPGKGAA